MATALANPGVLGSEFLSSRSGESLSSKHKSSLVNLNSRTSGFTITSRSAAFLCVAFAGNPGSQGGAQGSNHSAREIKKKTPYSKRRQRSLKSKKNVAAAHTGAGVASDISKNDLRALISNSLVPVFFDEVETSGEPEISQVSSENDQNAVLQSGMSRKITETVRIETCGISLEGGGASWDLSIHKRIQLPRNNQIVRCNLSGR